MTRDEFMEIVEFDEGYKGTIGEWKRKLSAFRDQHGLTDREVIAIARSHRGPFSEMKKLMDKFITD